MFLEKTTIPLDDIYVPVKRRRELDPDKVTALAESILEEGLKTPIGVRQDGDRVVLVSGLHRLEACRTLGETTIAAIFVSARQH